MDSFKQGRRTTEIDKYDDIELTNKKSCKKKKYDGESVKEKGSSKKRRVVWHKNPIIVVDVPSYKKYNFDNCADDPNTVKEKTRCSCFIF